MKTIEKCAIMLKHLIKKYNKDFWVAFFAVLIVHGEMLFNKIAWHDEVTTMFNGWNSGLIHGRWSHHYMATLVEKIAGLESIPVMTGCVVAACIGIIACFFFDIFEIEHDFTKFVLTLIFVAIPAVAGHLGYMGSAGFDFVGKLVCVLAAYLLCKGFGNIKNCWTIIGSSCLFAIALGEYQCYFAFYISIVLLYYLREVLKEELTWKTYLKKGISYVLVIIAGLMNYLLILQIVLKLEEVTLTDYAGTSSFGIVSLKGYILRLIQSYKEFVLPNLNSRYNMFPLQCYTWYRFFLVFLLLVLVSTVAFKLIIKKDYRGTIQFLILSAIFPCALNFNILLYGAQSVHSLHVYHVVLVFIYPFICINEVLKTIPQKLLNDSFGLIFGKLRILGVALTLILGLLYVRYDNYCYMVAEVKQEAAISYFTTLVTRIESVDGFNTEYPIAIVNETEKKGWWYVDNDEFPIAINPYDVQAINSRYSWKHYLREWCGFNASFVEPGMLSENPEVLNMPMYPNDGSIKIIDEIIVIKF